MKLSIFAAAAVVAGSLALAPSSASANHHYGHPGHAPAVCPAPAPVYHQPVCQPVCKPVCQEVRYCDPCRRSGLLGLGILGIL